MRCLALSNLCALHQALGLPPNAYSGAIGCVDLRSAVRVHPPMHLTARTVQDILGQNLTYYVKTKERPAAASSPHTSHLSHASRSVGRGASRLRPETRDPQTHRRQVESGCRRSLRVN